MHRVIIVSVVLVAAAAGSVAIADAIWNRATTNTIARLREQSDKSDAAATRFTRDDLAGLPPPVARYFAFALRDGQPLIRRARFTQEGSFAMRPGTWSPFTAVEHFAIGSRPGFVWDARIRIAPLVVARVRDSYLDGEGTIFGKIDALIPVVDQHGTAEMASGGLLRYLAEAVWTPTALLPASGVRWEAIDASSARATLTSSTASVSMNVDFGSTGEITRIAAQRYRVENGKAILTPWIGQFDGYARTAGMMVPLRAEVGWVLSSGWFPYWRGRTVRVIFDTM